MGLSRVARTKQETSGILITNQGRILAISTTFKKNGSRHHPKNKGGDRKTGSGKLHQTSQVCRMVIEYSTCFKEKWQT